MHQAIYLPCADDDTKVWRVSYFKPKGRPGAVSATEGELERTTTPGVSFFKAVLCQARYYRRELPGRATEKAIRTEMAALLDDLVQRGLLDPGAQQLPH